VALNYFALGPNAEAGASKSLGDYYSFTGPFAERIVGGSHKTPEAVQEVAKRFEDVGVDELIFFPAIAEVEQVDLLAEAVRPG
jgi:hypothetical protein